jgi:hypothetical protein
MFDLYAVAFGRREKYGYAQCIEYSRLVPDLVVYHPDCIALYGVCKLRIPAHSEQKLESEEKKDGLNQ